MNVCIFLSFLILSFHPNLEVVGMYMDEDVLKHMSTMKIMRIDAMSEIFCFVHLQTSKLYHCTVCKVLLLLLKEVSGIIYDERVGTFFTNDFH